MLGHVKTGISLRRDKIKVSETKVNPAEIVGINNLRDKQKLPTERVSAGKRNKSIEKILSPQKPRPLTVSGTS
jgi:hypothetical protein